MPPGAKILHGATHAYKLSAPLGDCFGCMLSKTELKMSPGAKIVQGLGCPGCLGCQDAHELSMSGCKSSAFSCSNCCSCSSCCQTPPLAAAAAAALALAAAVLAAAAAAAAAPTGCILWVCAKQNQK
uniref:Uncharacterized protein n=1 Tax=Dunaliella tertiolecta TaxID=3047 RepID=A0A6S8H8F1_DUNTE|eukprot:1149439-Pelagomonas_calceolata.AAC.4